MSVSELGKNKKKKKKSSLTVWCKWPISKRRLSKQASKQERLVSRQTNNNKNKKGRTIGKTRKEGLIIGI